MRSRTGAWVIAAAVAAAALFALTRPDTPGPLGRGGVAPDFSLPRAGGGADVSLSEHRGKVVLVNFWATWCKPCEDEMPAMERLYRELGTEHFELLAVSVDESMQEVDAFLQRMQLSFPVLLDADKLVSGAYQTYRFPESFLVGRDGVVVERYVGPREWDAGPYVSRLRRLLEAGPR